MKIKDVVCAAGSTGFYFDDQRAIKRGAGHDGMFYIGQPVTEGFSAVRMKGEAVSVMIVLEDGQIAFGDCAAVQYSGAGGRDPLFLAKDFIPIIEQYVRPMLLGREADDFRSLCAQMEAIEVNGKRLHTAIRYGVSQAILDAVAKATGRLMCEVVADEYGCTVSQTPIPIFTQSGDDRYDNADKMIIKRAQVLPHALINNVQTKLGEHGEKLLEYVKWLRDRILTMRADESYQPVLHIDVYGTIGAAFGNNNYAAMADYLAELEQAASEFLWEKYLSNDPLKMYVAFRIWNSYLLAREPRDRNAACDRFMDKMSRLTGVFQNETMSFDRETGKPKHFQAGSLYFKGAPSEDTRLDLWFPDNRRTEECVSAYASLYPLITYYLNRLNDWGLCFRRCKVCGKYFLAKSQRYELCSDKCRKAQALQNKREFDERSRENNYDLLYKNECQNWRNKINRVKNTAGFPADRLEKIQASFSDFKKEALQRKKAVKTGTASPKEFTDWLYQQSNVIVELTEI